MATGPLRILVVDDDEDSGELVEVFLLGLGHDVRLVTDGAAAVRQARSHRPHLILMDIGMPGNINGYEATRLIRAAAKAVPMIVAVTGWNRPEDVARGVRAGINHHLAKPFQLAAVQALLEQVPPLPPSTSPPPTRRLARPGTRPTGRRRAAPRNQ